LGAFLINKKKAIVFSCKGFDVSFVKIVFDDPLFKIVGDTGIKNCLLIIGKNVNVVLSVIIEHRYCRIDASFPGMTIFKDEELFNF